MTFRSEPVVSVLMTAYNREAFLAEAIESVLASDFDDFELIIADDASKDRTVEIARGFEAKDKRIQVLVNDTNLGDYPNRNMAASHARGTYLKYVDSDDAIYPWGLGVMVRCMQRFPTAGFGLSARAEFDRPHPVLFSPEAAYREEFLGRELFGRAPGSAIIRRNAFEAVGGFSGKRQLGDTEFWLKIGARYPLATLPPALLWNRVHPGQEQHTNSETERMAMRAEVALAALASPSCPLDMPTREMAIREHRRRLRRSFWRLLVWRREPRQALRYWRTVLLSARKPLG